MKNLILQDDGVYAMMYLCDDLRGIYKKTEYIGASRLILVYFFSNDTATTEIYTLSLHDALPIYVCIREATNTCRRLHFKRMVAKLCVIPKVISTTGDITDTAISQRTIWMLRLHVRIWILRRRPRIKIKHKIAER